MIKLTKELLIDEWFDHIPQILENQEIANKCDGTCQPFDLRPVYSTLERQIKEIKALMKEINNAGMDDYGNGSFMYKGLTKILENKNGK